jgi:hypothetical protein
VKIDQSHTHAHEDDLESVPIMDILSNSHIHVSSSYHFRPFLSYRNEEYICLSVMQCIVIDASLDNRVSIIVASVNRYVI